MINGQREIWISTDNKSKHCSAIIAVSNCGRIMRKNGKIEIASLRQIVFVGEKRSRILMYHFLANNFITKTEDDILKQRNFIDHISHAPTNMHINDVRNLRWCTNKENCNFKEAKLNRSKAKKGNTNAKGKRSEEAKEKMSKAQIGHFVSDETKEKMSSNKKGRHWYNNGSVAKFARECPPGFVPGMLRKI